MKKTIRYKLRELSESKFEDLNFNFGDCDVYAVALHRLYGYPLYVLRGYFLEPEWGGKREWDYEDCHIMVKLPNGKFLDSDGEATLKRLKELACFGNEVEKIKAVPIDEETALSTFSCENQEDNIKRVMTYIQSQKKLNEGINNDDEINKKENSHLTSLCNTMSVKTYEEVIGRLISAIGTKEENPETWEKIAKPLKMLQEANKQINNEKKTQGMTGDSMVDESNTWWAAIQSTLCK